MGIALQSLVVGAIMSHLLLLQRRGATPRSDGEADDVDESAARAWGEGEAGEGGGSWLYYRKVVRC